MIEERKRWKHPACGKDFTHRGVSAIILLVRPSSSCFIYSERIKETLRHEANKNPLLLNEYNSGALLFNLISRLISISIESVIRVVSIAKGLLEDFHMGTLNIFQWFPEFQLYYQTIL